MLVNKLIIEYGYMFVRSTDPKYLKYIMDLGIIPIITYVNINGPICRLSYGSYVPKIKISEIRPLTIREIKHTLRMLTIIMQDPEYQNLSFGELIYLNYPQVFILRNNLWKKY